MGQAERGGLVAACRPAQALCQGQWAGRCRTGLPCGWASRAGTVTRCRRRVAVRALAWNRLVRLPAARSRLWQMAAQMAQAALALN